MHCSFCRTLGRKEKIGNHEFKKIAKEKYIFIIIPIINLTLKNIKTDDTSSMKEVLVRVLLESPWNLKVE